MEAYNSILSVLLHCVLVVNAGCVIFLITYAAAARTFPDQHVLRARLTLLGCLVVSIKVLYVLLFGLLAPELIVADDGVRYFHEIRGIAEEPWRWNPFLGKGPNYQASPKMGMSYLYGSLLFAHQIKSVVGVLILNVVVGYFTCLVVFLLTWEISADADAAFIALLLTAIYPETLYWNGLVLRESLALLLVASLVYSLVRYYKYHAWSYLCMALVAALGLMLTRAQLVLFLPLILVYYATIGGLFGSGKDRLRFFLQIIVLALALAAAFDFISKQVGAAGGAFLFEYLAVDSGFWSEQVDRLLGNIGQSLSLVARQEHGAVGLVLAPFASAVMVLSVGMILRFGVIFRGHRIEAGLLLYLIVVYIIMLAMVGLPNIRFRAMVAPLQIALVSPAVVYYWRVLSVPRLGLFSRGSSTFPVHEG